jgi:hypothetical protein
MGQEARRPVSNRGQAEPFERRVGASPCRREDAATATELPAPVVAGLGGEADILPGGHLREKCGELKGAGDAALRRQPGSADSRARAASACLGSKLLPNTARCLANHSAERAAPRPETQTARFHPRGAA